MITTFGTNVRNYWNYYLELESEFFQTKRYVEFDKNNYETFSIEYLKLFEAICSEIDVVGKYIASKKNPKFDIKKAKSINHWWIEIQDILSIYDYLDYWNYPNDKPINICLKSVYNHLLYEYFNPWKNYQLEYYIDSIGAQRIRLKAGCETPQWWKDYNAVKHHRTTVNSAGEINFKKANLGNVCSAIAALYILEMTILQLPTEDQDEVEHFINESTVFIKNEKLSINDLDKICV